MPWFVSFGWDTSSAGLQTPPFRARSAALAHFNHLVSDREAFGCQIDRYRNVDGGKAAVFTNGDFVLLFHKPYIE